MRMEVDAGGAAVLLRTLPLVVRGEAAGAAVLIRDVTEIKRRDRALLSKDATIREIHHRVKNNLQTVAALLRLQARRTNNAEGREALIESVRRVSSIALVHDALSMSVDEEVNLDEVVDRILPMMNDVAAPANMDTPIRITRVGDLGVLDADRATALVMVITELVQNAIEHGFDGATQAGCVTIRAERSARWLDVVVHDDGRGLPEGFSLEKADRLGLQIVRTLVSAELDGSLGMHAVPTGGTDVVLRVPIGQAGAGSPSSCRLRELSDYCVIRTNCAIAHSYGPDIFAGAVSVGRGGLDAGAGLRAGVAPLECAALVLAHSAPDACILAGVQCPGQALGGDRAAVAHELRVSDLGKGRAAVSHGEEQFRILVATDRLVAPIHGV